MRIEVSSGKSVSRRFAICSGLHARAPPAGFGASISAPLSPKFGPRDDPSVRPPAVATLPAGRSCTYLSKAGSSRVWQAWGGVRHGRHATAPCERGTQGHRGAWLRCAATRARSSRALAPVAGRSLERLLHERAQARSVHARREKRSGLSAPARTVQDSVEAYRRIGGTICCRRPTADDTPATLAASSLEQPSEIAPQNGLRSDRCGTSGRLGEPSFARSDRSDFNFF